MTVSDCDCECPRWKCLDNRSYYQLSNKQTTFTFAGVSNGIDRCPGSETYSLDGVSARRRKIVALFQKILRTPQLLQQVRNNRPVDLVLDSETQEFLFFDSLSYGKRDDNTEKRVSVNPKILIEFLIKYGNRREVAFFSTVMNLQFQFHKAQEEMDF